MIEDQDSGLNQTEEGNEPVREAPEPSPAESPVQEEPVPAAEPEQTEEIPAAPQPEEAEPEIPTVEEPLYQAPAEAEQARQPVPPQPQPVYPYAPPPLYVQPQQTWYPPQQGQAQQPPYGTPVPPQQAPYPYQGGYAQQPVYPQQPAAYYPPAQPYYAPPVNPPKKKMSTGLKVFIWIASILAGIAIIGFGVFVAMNYSPKTPGIAPGFDFNMPQLPDPGSSPEQDDDIPKFDDDVIPPDDKEDNSNRPQVDVTPNTEGITIEKKPTGRELTAQEVYQKVVKSTVTVAVSLERGGEEQKSTGTGIIATSDGYIITNAHVVLNSKSSTVRITTFDGTECDAVVVGADRTTDLAILKTNDHDFTPAEFGSVDELVIGDSVIAIGNPGGEKFSGSMTGGYISGLDRLVGKYSENGMTYIQTDAAINPGNSGGPLVNMYGQVIGINSSKIITEGYEGMGFAIPVSKAKPIIDELLSGGYVKGRTRLGITGTEVTDSQAMFYRCPKGFLISEINEESAFTGTEAEVGDIIIAIDGETVEDLSDISNLLLKYAPGDKVTITLYRQNGQELDVTATLLEDRGETQQ